MGFLREQGFEQFTLIVVDQRMDIAGYAGVGRVHRLARHTLDHGDAGNDDALLAHFDHQPLDEHLPVGENEGIIGQPCPQFCSFRAGQVAIAVASFEGGKLLVPGLGAACELGDDVGIDANLFCDMVEHDCREKLAFAQMPPRKAEAPELKGVAKPGFRSTRLCDGGKVGGVETMMANDRLFGVGQRQQCAALLLRHRDPGRHRNIPSKTACHSASF